MYEKQKELLFYISSNRKTQPFDVYIVYSRDYAYDGRYKTKVKHLFERASWVEEDSNEDGNRNESQNEDLDRNEDRNKDPNESSSEVSHKCTEADKSIVFEIEYFSAKHLEHPFTTDCVLRTDANHRPILQYDCYEECMKTNTV